MAVDGPDRFADLVTEVQHRAATADPARLLDAAAAISAQHAADADRLLDHFVALARDAGMSWTDIGARLGVSKQAARQRFTAAPPAVMPFAARTALRLQACLDQAAEQARTDGADAIGNDHLLAGLLTEGVAAAILERLGVHAEQIQAYPSAHPCFLAAPCLANTMRGSGGRASEQPDRRDRDDADRGDQYRPDDGRID